MQEPNENAKSDNKIMQEDNSTPQGIILERIKRMKALPTRSRDLVSEYFVHHYLHNKRYFL